MIDLRPDGGNAGGQVVGGRQPRGSGQAGYAHWKGASGGTGAVIVLISKKKLPAQYLRGLRGFFTPNSASPARQPARSGLQNQTQRKAS
ncbi:hypothetical protein BLL52_2876 [Rhodoferax antarcticus ANT.BR]|uniref:Uncharacterized protein n=1 Tax=Rhodoferax antarcticus ANT.BR TaxID=1111071 RepID=A0A1Q8YFI4_9BURK|nr:hypothetical protein BLL52_2876 [Rhodoferax antarcticus ANT.BR]